MSFPTAPLPSATLTALLHDSHLLSLLHHRNSNQHRLTKWYRHLTSFHRHLRHLLHDSTLVTDASTTPERNSAIARANQRISYLRDVVVPRAYDAFGTVVRDNQFVALGVVLWGVLARVWRLLGGKEMVAREREAEMRALKEMEMKDVEEVEEMEDIMEGEVLSREAYEKAIEEEKASSRIEIKSVKRTKEEKEARRAKKKEKRPETEAESEASSATSKDMKERRKRDKNGVIKEMQRETETLPGGPKKRKKQPVDDDGGDVGVSDKSGLEKKKRKKRRKRMTSMLSLVVFFKPTCAAAQLC